MPDERMGPEAGYGVADDEREQALGGARVTYVDAAAPLRHPGPEEDESGAIHESKLEEGGGHGRFAPPKDAPYFPAEGGQRE